MNIGGFISNIFGSGAYKSIYGSGAYRKINVIIFFFLMLHLIVKEFLETAKEEFEEKWKNPVKVSLFSFIFFLFISVQDFLDKAKKEFEEQWSKNIKVR